MPIKTDGTSLPPLPSSSRGSAYSFLLAARETDPSHVRLDPHARPMPSLAPPSLLRRRKAVLVFYLILERMGLSRAWLTRISADDFSQVRETNPGEFILDANSPSEEPGIIVNTSDPSLYRLHLQQDLASLLLRRSDAEEALQGLVDLYKAPSEYSIDADTVEQAWESTSEGTRRVYPPLSTLNR